MVQKIGINKYISFGLSVSDSVSLFSVSAKNFHFGASLVLTLSFDIVDKTVMIQLYLLDPHRGETDPTQSPGA